MSHAEEEKFRNLTLGLMDAIAVEHTSWFVCFDEGFEGDDQLKANAAQTFKSRVRDKESEIIFREV